MVDDQDGCEWVHVFSGTGSPGSPGQRAVKRLLLLLLLLEEQSIEMTQERHVQTSPNVACDRGSVLLQQRWDRLCTSCSTDDVVFPTVGQAKATREHGVYWKWLTKGSTKSGLEPNVYDCNFWPELAVGVAGADVVVGSGESFCSAVAISRHQTRVWTDAHHSAHLYSCAPQPPHPRISHTWQRDKQLRLSAK